MSEVRRTSEAPSKDSGSSPLIEIRNLHKRFETGTASIEVLKGLDLTLDVGDRVAIVGHWHRPAWHSRGEQRQLTLGAFRNEFELEPDGTIGRALGNVHAEVWMRGDQVLTSNLVETMAPPPFEGYMPDHIDAFRPVIREHLESLADRSSA